MNEQYLFLSIGIVVQGEDYSGIKVQPNQWICKITGIIDTIIKFIGTQKNLSGLTRKVFLHM